MLIFEKLSRYLKNKKMKSRFVREVIFHKTSVFHQIKYVMYPPPLTQTPIFNIHIKIFNPLRKVRNLPIV